MSKAYKVLPPAETLWEYFDLDLWTGRLLRKPIKGSTSKLSPFGSISTKGYIYGMFKGSTYYAHRLVWCWVHGTSPGLLEIDHIDRNRSNNMPFNLRLVAAHEQARNTAVYRNNKLGLKGVHRLPGKRASYQARIRVNGVMKHLGCYSTKEEASYAYKRAADEHFGILAGAWISTDTVNSANCSSY